MVVVEEVLVEELAAPVGDRARHEDRLRPEGRSVRELRRNCGPLVEERWARSRPWAGVERVPARGGARRKGGGHETRGSGQAYLRPVPPALAGASPRRHRPRSTLRHYAGLLGPAGATAGR